MKKVLIAVLAVAFLFVGNNLVVAQTDLSDSDIQIWGNASIFVGAGTAFFENQTYQKLGFGRDDRNTTDYRIDLYLSKTFENDGKLVLRLRGGDAGAFALGAYRGNANDSHNNDNFEVKELWYTQPLFDNFVAVTLGKLPALDSTNNLGGATQFFTNDATIITPQSNIFTAPSSGGNPFTVKVAINPIDLLTVTYAYSSNANDNSNSGGENQFTANGYNAVEVNFKPTENGNYRIGYWSNNQQNDVYTKGVPNLDTEEKDGASGFWLSFDQKIVDPLTLFARFGLRLDKTYTSKDFNEQFGTVGFAGQVWQFGGLVSGSLWSRDDDSVFLAVGQVNNIKDTATDIRIVLNDKRVERGFAYTETHVELNYNFALSEAVTITPIFEYVIGTIEGDKLYTGYVYGVKTGYKF